MSGTSFTGGRQSISRPISQHEIPRRFSERIMFGADYPMLSYDRLVSDWRALGYGDDVLDKVFVGNAKRFLS